MSRESHKRYLEQAALKAAQKAFDKKAPHPLDRESLGRLRIQTVEPWKRILLGLLSLFFLWPGITLIITEPFWAGVIVTAIGAGLLAFAMLGRKKTIDAALDGIDVIHLAAQFFDAL